MSVGLLLMGSGCVIDMDASLFDFSATLESDRARTVSNDFFTTFDQRPVELADQLEEVHGPVEESMILEEVTRIKNETNFSDPQNVTVTLIEDEVKSDFFKHKAFESISRIYGTYTCGNSDPVAFNIDLLYKMKTDQWHLLDFRVSHCN